MAANDRLQRWHQELQDLQSLRMRLADAWNVSLSELRQTGRPPALELLEEQSVYGMRVASLTADISLDHPQISQFGSPQLDAISRLCEELQVKQEARTVLEEVLGWEHTAEPDFEPLRVVQSQARRLLNELSRCPIPGEQLAVFRELAAGQHPMCDLVRLQQSGEDVDDQDWTRWHDRVTETYGRAMATAIGRGRIVSTIMSVRPVVAEPSPATIPLKTEPAAPPPVEIETPPAAALPDIQPEIPRPALAEPPAMPIPASQSQPAAPPAEEPDFVYDFQAAGASMTGVLDTAIERVIPKPAASPTGSPLLPADSLTAESNRSDLEEQELPTDADAHETWSQLRAQRLAQWEEAAHHGTPAAALADAALKAAGEDRVRCLFRLIDQLLIDDHASLAYHLMTTVESFSPKRLTAMPSSLLRAYLVSRQVCYPQGELNRRVEEDLKKQQPRRLQEAPREERLAHEFLCRGAALLPALLCSSSAAVRLLQAFPIDPKLIQLYNYCSRIASYAERLQGKTAEMLQGTNGSGPVTQELEALRESARSWLAATIKQSVPYVRSSPLFLKAHWTVMSGTVQRSPEAAQAWGQYQETLLTAHRLLRPVIQGQTSERTWVKHEIERLAPQLTADAKRGGMSIHDAYSPVAAENQGILQQAIEYANGWLRLSGGNFVASTNLPIRELEELRTEIRGRSAAVLDELRPFASIQNPQSLRAATFCLQRIVQQIDLLVSAQNSLGWKEPEFKHLLHGELLKIPALPLNDQWEPQIDAEELESVLLEHLSRGATTYYDAFERHCELGDHAATARLIELPVWQSTQEVEELVQVRQEKLAGCRRDFLAEIEELDAETRVRAQAGQLSPANQATALRRLDRLRTAINKTFDFQSAEMQLQQVRLLLQRHSSSTLLDDSADMLRPPADKPEAAETSLPVRNVVPETTPPAESIMTPENSWVMDILFEDR